MNSVNAPATTSDGSTGALARASTDRLPKPLLALEAAVTEFVCYDLRLATAARDLGFVVTAPT